MKQYYKPLFFLSGLVAISMLSACSNIKDYSNHKPHNMSVKTKTNSGSSFSNIKTSLNIYSLNKKCETDYLGNVELDSEKTKIGLSTRKLLYLDFSFVSSGYFSPTSSMNYDTLLKPRKGAQYYIELSYLDDMYNMEIWEKRSKKRSKKELEIRAFDSCKAGK